MHSAVSETPESDSFTESELRNLLDLRQDTVSDLHDKICRRSDCRMSARDGSPAAPAASAQPLAAAALQIGEPETVHLEKWAHHCTCATTDDKLLALVGQRDANLISCIFSCQRKGCDAKKRVMGEDPDDPQYSDSEPEDSDTDESEDEDAEQEGFERKGVCWHCGAKGHWLYECPNRVPRLHKRLKERLPFSGVNAVFLVGVLGLGPWGAIDGYGECGRRLDILKSLIRLGGGHIHNRLQPENSAFTTTHVIVGETAPGETLIGAAERLLGADKTALLRQGLAVVTTDWITSTVRSGAPVDVRTALADTRRHGLRPGLMSAQQICSSRLDAIVAQLEGLESRAESRRVAIETHRRRGRGRMALARGHTDARPYPGRFGWKAQSGSVREQSAEAFAGDIGISSPDIAAPHGDCTDAQPACLAMPDGVQDDLGRGEATAQVMDLVTFYAENLAVPARRDVDDPGVLRGKALFHRAGCPACHTPKFVTRRDAANPAHAFQLIWPHSDFLLHDMGPGLADGQRVGVAGGTEWRTQPLWGIGLTAAVSGRTRFLHDGRARNLEEAILWHGGEAQAARDRYAGLDAADRAALIRFLESL